MRFVEISWSLIFLCSSLLFAAKHLCLLNLKVGDVNDINISEKNIVDHFFCFVYELNVSSFKKYQLIKIYFYYNKGSCIVVVALDVS